MKRGGGGVWPVLGVLVIVLLQLRYSSVQRFLLKSENGSETSSHSRAKTETLLVKNTNRSSPFEFSTYLSNQSNTTNSNRTLVVVMGSLRGGPKAWSSLFEHVLDLNQADLAVLTGVGNTTTTMLHDRAKYWWTFDEYDDWADAIDLIDGPGWRNVIPKYLHNESSAFGGVKMRQYKASGAIVLLFRWFLTQRIQQEDLLNKYERFVVTRSDHYYLCPHNLSELDSNSLWAPQGEEYWGITDRHLVVSSADLLTALDVLPHILQHAHKYRDILRHKFGNPEQLIKRRWKLGGLWERLQQFPRVMFTCAVPGDSTRAQTMSTQPVAEGVFLKYEREYVQSYATCGKVNLSFLELVQNATDDQDNLWPFRKDMQDRGSVLKKYRKKG